MAKRQHGAVMVEAALALPIFLLIVLVGADLLRVSYYSVAIQFLSARALRSAVLTDASSGPARAVVIRDEVLRLGRRYGVELDPESIKICVGISSDCTHNDAGLPTDLITVTIRQRVNTIVGFALPRQFILTGQVVGRNEYYFQT